MIRQEIGAKGNADAGALPPSLAFEPFDPVHRDIAFAFSSPHFDIMSRPATALPRKGAAARCAAFLYHWIRWGKFRSERSPDSKRRGGLVVYVNTRNQAHAVAPIVAHLPDSRIFGEFGVGDYAFPTAKAFRRSLRWAGPVLRSVPADDNYLVRSSSYFLDQYVLAPGYFEVAHAWLAELTPAAVLISNDHNLQQRAIMHAARILGIPTIYVQHAAVTDKFPPLTVDYALLDGIDTLRKYENSGASATTVFLTGSPKFDPLLTSPVAKEFAIGLCTNRLDSVSAVENVCKHIVEAFPTVRIVLRVHPADKRRREWKSMAERLALQWDPTGRPVSEFLAAISVVIAGGSSILVEAGIAGRVPIAYPFNHEFGDPYGLAAARLVAVARNPVELIGLIRKHAQPSTADKQKWRAFCATIGTQFEGRSTELAASVIAAIVSEKLESLPGWRRLEDTRLNAYGMVANQPDPERFDESATALDA